VVASLQFEEPHAGLRDSYRELVNEFRRAGEKLVPFPLAFPNDDFGAYLERLEACKRGEGDAASFVPHTTYWLVERGVVVGVANMRHRLTDALRREGGHIGYGVRPTARGRGFAHDLLRGALARARLRGLSEVLLTCGKDNVASVKTIVGGGGELVSEEYFAERGEVVQRYVIVLDCDGCAGGEAVRAG
jgi:predicted acetyltransferase